MKTRQNLKTSLLISCVVLALSTVLLLVCNANPVTALNVFLNGIFGNTTNLFEVFVKATPLILTSLGCAIAFKTGFFNIGAEGQFYVGAIATTYIALNLTAVDGVFRVIIAMIFGFIAGGIYSFFAAYLKAKLQISEIIVTIMLNYIAINLTGLAVRTFLMDPSGSVPQSARLDSSVAFSLLYPPTRLNIGFFIAIILAGLLYVVMEKTTIGYELKVVGFNKRAASCNGISTMKNIIISAVLSGGLAGIAGSIEILGTQKKLIEGISADCGYTAVLIALLASNNPINVVLIAIGFSALQVGANSVQRQLGVPSAIVNVIIGSVVLLILAKKIFEGKKLK